MNKKSHLIRNMSGIFTTVLFSLLIISSAQTTAFGQAINTSVNGTVKDQAGAVLRGARVTLIDVATGHQSVTTTNNQGFFVFPEVR
ncbi:MAG: carboxypeptidase-like regulatory domain-containing protein, partial [Blastocatellia bacterium]